MMSAPESSAVGPFGLSQGLWENIEVGLGFFVLEVLLIVIVLPFTLSRIERRKWQPMREAIVERVLWFDWWVVTHVELVFAHSFDDYFHPFHSRTDCPKLHQALAKSLRSRNLIDETEAEFRKEIDFLGPAVEPAMAGPLVRFLSLPKSLTWEVDSIFFLLTPNFGLRVKRKHDVKGRVVEQTEHLVVKPAPLYREVWRATIWEQMESLARKFDEMNAIAREVIASTTLSKNARRAFTMRFREADAKKSRLLNSLTALADRVFEAAVEATGADHANGVPDTCDPPYRHCSLEGAIEYYKARDRKSAR